jgi:hypothetical protein
MFEVSSAMAGSHIQPVKAVSNRRQLSATRFVADRAEKSDEPRNMSTKNTILEAPKPTYSSGDSGEKAKVHSKMKSDKRNVRPEIDDECRVSQRQFLGR